MQTFEEVMATDPPRLVVEFRRGPGGEEQFQWGVVKAAPLLTVLGFITRVQSELFFKAPPDCEASALVIVWIESERRMAYWCNKDIPVDPLVGLLEAIKFTLLGSNAARQQAPPPIVPGGRRPPGILGLDGRPFRG